jgi:hypothetical protein
MRYVSYFQNRGTSCFRRELDSDLKNESFLHPTLFLNLQKPLFQKRLAGLTIMTGKKFSKNPSAKNLEFFSKIFFAVDAS